METDTPFKIEQKIIAQKVISDVVPNAPAVKEVQLEVLNEQVERPYALSGKTYKIKPNGEFALYITVNDYICNEGTDNESIHPFEVFINSKSVEHFQWVTAITRAVSSVFRKGGNIEYIVEELQEVFDPAGGYYDTSGKYHTSIVAQIGKVIQEHFYRSGHMKRPELDDHMKAIIEEKSKVVKPDSKGEMCQKCREHAVHLIDNCPTCLSCGDSKCG